MKQSLQKVTDELRIKLNFLVLRIIIKHDFKAVYIFAITNTKKPYLGNIIYFKTKKTTKIIMKAVEFFINATIKDIQ